ncbi:hypothetical protein MGWOODY_Hyp425 [hydrothermal vent metagenome]|uniref:Uncharacterized protein n=1 Tax=hydrothermal vent metagenome TaxID=652676 RepID=A0A160U1A1_9ZZZZ
MHDRLEAEMDLLSTVGDNFRLKQFPHHSSRLSDRAYCLT